MTDQQALVVGPGFQQWIDDHQGTPESDELPLTREQQMMIARVSENGQDVRYLLLYNKLTNLVIPFVQAT